MSKRVVLLVAAILALALVLSIGLYMQRSAPNQQPQTASETQTSSGPVLDLDNKQISDKQLEDLKENLSQLLNQIKELSQVDIGTTPANLQLTQWVKSVASEVAADIQQNPLTATYTSYSPDELTAMMGQEPDIKKRIAILAVYYQKTASNTLGWGEAFTITQGPGNPIDAMSAILRAKSMVLTLKDADSFLSMTSTQAMLEKLLPIVKEWEANYKNQLQLLKQPELPAIQDVVTLYYPLIPLMSAPQNTASQIINTLSATSGITASTMAESDILFLIYSAEHTRVAAEALTEINSLTQRSEPAPDLENSMAKAWDNIQGMLKITLPEEVTSTEAKKAFDTISQNLTEKYGFDNRDIGNFMINMLLDDWRIYKTEKDMLRRLVATAEANGIAGVLTGGNEDVKNALHKTFPAPQAPETGFDLKDSDLAAIAKLNVYLAKKISANTPLKAEIVATAGDAVRYAAIIAPQLEELLNGLNKDNYASVYGKFSSKLNDLLKVLLMPTMNLQTGAGSNYLLP